MDNTISPLGVFLASFGVSALAGLAALLRSGKPLTILGLLSAILNSGLLGLGICLLWFTKFQDNIYFLVGVCVMAGLGGMTTIDFALTALRKGGFSIKLGEDGRVELPDNGEKNEKDS